jgi:hypothetical protein
MREHFRLEENALLEEFIGQLVVRLCREQRDPRRRLRLVIQLPMLDQEMVVLGDRRPGFPGLRLALDQRAEESALDVARGRRAKRIGLCDGELLFGRAGDAALAGAAVVKVVLILQGLPKLLLAVQEFDFARVARLPMTRECPCRPPPRSLR